MNDWRSDNRRQGKRRGGSKDFGDDFDEFGGGSNHGKRNKPERGGRRDAFGEAGWAEPPIPDAPFPTEGRPQTGGRGPRSFGDDRGGEGRRGPGGGSYGGQRAGGDGGPRGGGYGGPRGGGDGGPRDGAPRGGGGGGSFADRGPRRAPPPAAERGPRQGGTVKFFKADKGFGFIMPDSGEPDVFVHISAVERSGLTTLESDQRVTFETEPDRHGKGPKAVELKIEDGGES